jgi:uncharacterized membrane protein
MMWANLYLLFWLSLFPVGHQKPTGEQQPR